MIKFLGPVLFVTLFSTFAFDQTKPIRKPSATKSAYTKPTVAARPALDRGKITGRTYRNESLGFEITFPDTWLIPGDDFEAEMKKAGYDLSLKAPANVGPQARAKMNQALKKVTVLLTAYRSMPGLADNAIVRISVENLGTNPQIKDAVDYFDAMRSQFKAMPLPADFKYSETDAEQLGLNQFALIDSSTTAGKKRMYATVRNGYAILFTLSYTADEDLQTMRQILSEGNFRLR